MTTAIRDARPADADEVARLMRLVGTAILPGDARAREGLEDFLAAGGVVLIAEEGGAVVGACTLLITRWNPMDETPAAWLDGLVVDEGFRRRGIGSALMREARRRAEEAGCDSILLHTHEDERPAVALYERLDLARHGLLLFWDLR
ncbi:MAG TPA: GNAT family N-acetyltransferase [Actinomycetota bacterium]